MLMILDTYSQMTEVSTGGIVCQHIQLPQGQLVVL